MACFDSLDWQALDVWAIVQCRGIATLHHNERQLARNWLSVHQYESTDLDFSSGISTVVRQLNELLDWKSQFGYDLKPESRNLNALRDGFDFAVPDRGGLVLNVIGFEHAWEEDARWATGFLSIASEFSIRQLALGKRFFVLIELSGPNSSYMSQEFDVSAVGSPFRFHRRNTTS